MLIGYTNSKNSTKKLIKVDHVQVNLYENCVHHAFVNLKYQINYYIYNIISMQRKLKVFYEQEQQLARN